MVFSAAELTDMRTAQTDHMMDTVYISVYSEAVDSFGQMIPTYTDALATTACGLDMRPGSEQHRPDKTALEYDATVRLPITTAITARDRIKVTKRFGEVLGTALIFDIVGPVQRGPSGIRLLLKRVET